MFILKVEDNTSYCLHLYSLSHCLESFCSNDKNLCSKALLSGVKALSKADLVKEVEGTRSTILNYFHAHPAVPPTAGPVDKGLLLILALSISQFLLHWLCFS